MKRSSTAGEDAVGGEVEIITANVLMLLSQGFCGGAASEEAAGRVFECKTCSRRFPSFQALGGHRASHKKPRGDQAPAAAPAAEKPKVHECSVCGLEFAIGQALGGHMRRHRVVAGDGAVIGFGGGICEDGEKIIKAGGAGDGCGDRRPAAGLDLDLNLPPVDSDQDVRLLRFELDCLHY